jgi:hypothetical protein
MFLSAKRQPVFVGRAIEVNRPYLSPVVFDGSIESSVILFAPFGKDFTNHLFRVATMQHRVILKTFSPVENVTVISLRRFI